ncbi:hypothetical protein QG9_2013 [Clostridioides difficile CD178]|nr:hypothetical protein QG3_2186 [Clostridioides difficile CD169]EQF51476.1 hypothetical protein QG9_2013 [Clostridioides difficile CD178]EQG45897.1 hypothetical protein QIW_2168 [Clostridioides difficile DA00134]EQG52343.1 hypothetical protein QIY_2067 [Clostridioides difficile DA00141]EQH29204.1 hypothetical protein QM3_2034 [Clostridioides difficile DA00215]EQI73305.1 hypothetical protein QQE_2061 [Clostridioides difficile Y381]EQK01085.1 hypothetical protein QUK_2051 [Clostridioides diffi
MFEIRHIVLSFLSFISITFFNKIYKTKVKNLIDNETNDTISSNIIVIAYK